jgi:molybdenum cofactor cytidylyltransferase
MIRFPNVAALLLCAGLSRRFGAADKLRAPLHGRPLVAHAADLLRALPFRERIAVIRAGPPGDALRPCLAGFALVENDRPEAGKDRSIRLGLDRALAGGAEAVLVMLGDMPNVTPAHLRELAAAAGPQRAAIGLAGDWRSPPVLLPASLASAMLGSDAPVRSFLGKETALVAADPALLADIDTPARLAALSA